MAARFLSRTISLAAALAGSASLAQAHEAEAEHAWRAGLGSWQALAGATPVALAAGFGVAALAIALLLRNRGTPLEAGMSIRHRRSRWLAGAALALVLWALPWLSLHDTHHALEKGDLSCPVAQIVNNQGAGVLPSMAALDRPVAAGTIVLRDPQALTSRATPQPAARSPPV